MSKRRVTQSVTSPPVNQTTYLILSRMLAAFVLLVLLVQPIAPAFANEEEVATSPPEATDSSTESPKAPESEANVTTADSAVDLDVGTTAAPEAENIDSGAEAEPVAATDNQLSETESGTLELEVEIETESVASSTAESGAVIVDSNTPSPQETESATGTNSTIEEPVTPVVIEDEITPETASSTEGAPEAEVTEVPTTTPELISPATPSDTNEPDTEITPEADDNETASSTGDAPLTVNEYTVTNDENRYSFTRDECVAMGEGTFYCAKPEQIGTPVITERVFAEADEHGDREIYVDLAGERRQITDNDVDDDAPVYDEESNSLVWHRLLDGRFQIVTYDLASKEEKVLTNDRFNNMHPSRHRDAIVWQAWVGNDWDIMLDVAGVVTMLSDNAIPDIAPRINGDFVIWQAFENGSWQVKVYNRSTGVTDTIADADGASVQNPRFVLVYDAKRDNGDIETLGYDLADKVTVPLSATPASAPKDLPEPEQTGEERALVQPTVTVKQKVEAIADGAPDPDAEADDTETTVGTTTPDIVIPPYSEVETAGATTSDDITLTDTDDEIPAPEADTALLEPIVPDLIITPFVEPIEPTTDPQSEVASPQ